MKGIENHLKAAYGKFPYLVNRIRSGLYQIIPIHEPKYLDRGYKGTYVKPEAIETFGSFEAACFQFAESFRFNPSDPNHITRCCLVLNEHEGHYYHNGAFTGIGEPPSGTFVIGPDDEYTLVGQGESTVCIILPQNK